jgi:signal peptidase I
VDQDAERLGAVDTLGPLRVPDGHYFVLGDCRDNARDSREYGFVPKDKIRARVIWTAWSADHTRIGQPVQYRPDGRLR